MRGARAGLPAGNYLLLLGLAMVKLWCMTCFQTSAIVALELLSEAGHQLAPVVVVIMMMVGAEVCPRPSQYLP